MAVDCPHCKAALPPEYLTQDDIKNRIASVAKARDEALAAAAKAVDERDSAKATADAQVKIANEKAEAASAATTKSLADAQKAIAERDRFQALAADGIVKPAKVKGFSLAYDAYVAEAGTAAKPFAEWLAADARSDEFLAQHFAKPAEAAPPAADAAKAPPAAAAPAAPPPPAGKPLPASNLGVGDPPLTAGKLTEAQMAQQYKAGVDELRAKFPDRKQRSERDAAIRELQTKLQNAAAAGPAV